MLKDYKQTPKSQVTPAKADQQYPTYPGRVIYQQLGLTRLNTVPVNIHRDSATSEAVLSGDDAKHTEIADPADIAEGMLIDGGMLATFDGEQWIPHDNIVSMDKTRIVEDVTPQSQYSVTRYSMVYDRISPDMWEVSMLVTQDGGQSKVESVENIPDSLIAYTYFGKDILYWNQWTWQRLEEIKWAIQRESSDFNLSTIIVGELGRNAQGAIDQLNRGQRIAALPGRNSNAIKVGDSGVMDKLDTEYSSLRNDYLVATYLIDMSNQPNRPVALDSELRLAPQTRYKDSLRKSMVKFYDQFGIALTFDTPTRMGMLESNQSKTGEYND